MWLFYFDDDGVKAEPYQKERCPYEIPKLRDIIKLFDNGLYRTDRSRFLGDFFELMAIFISNQVDRRPSVWAAREARFEDIKKAYDKREFELFQKMFAEVYKLCSSVVYENGAFADYLGEFYMQSNTSNAKLGQFFTPYHVSKLCAKATITKEDVLRKAADGGILTINDPCCGSGGMLLAALDVIGNDYGINYADKVFISCGDIDRRCVHMCYIQLSLAGVPAIIKQQNALSRELYDVWKTPAYIFQYMKFRKFENCILNG